MHMVIYCIFPIKAKRLAKVKKSGIDKSSVSLYHCKIKTGRRNAVPFLSVCVIVMLKLRGEIR